MEILLIVLAFIVGAVLGYFVAFKQIPKTLAKMSSEDLTALANKVSAERDKK